MNLPQQLHSWLVVSLLGCLKILLFLLFRAIGKPIPLEMGDILTRITELPPTLLNGDDPFDESEVDEQLKKLISLLNSIAANQLTPQLLDRLSLPYNTCTYLYTLLASVEHGDGPTPDSVLWPRVEEFVRNFNPHQVRWAGHQFRRLLEAIARGARTSRDPRPGLTLIREALLRLDPKSSTFGSLHLMFIELCLHKRLGEEAIPILDNDICDIALFDSSPTEWQDKPLCSVHIPSSMFITQAKGFTTEVTYRHLLDYYIYGATLYLIARRYDRALIFLKTAMKHETLGSASTIQVEAYKRWIIANLLKRGAVPEFPRGVNGQAAKNMRAMSKAYEALRDAFKQETADKLHEQINAGERVWAEDSTTGIVMMLPSAHQRHALLALKSEWGSLPMKRAYELAFPPSVTYQEAHEYVADLITTKQIDATLQLGSPTLQSAVLRLNEKNGFKNYKNQDVDRSGTVLVQKAIVDTSARVAKNKRHKRQTHRPFSETIIKARKAEAEGKKSGQGASNGDEWLGKDEEMLEAA